MTIEERLEKLEMELAAEKRLTRWLKYGASAGFVLGVLALFIAVWSMTGVERFKKGGEVIRAKRFNVVDDKGKTRASLWEQNLFLLDEKGTARVLLGMMNETGPKLFILDEKGAVRARIGTSTTKSPDGKVISYPESSILLYDPDGKVIWQAPGENHSEFVVADSLYNEKLYLQAISEFSRFLNGVNADYAFYKIGLCKNEIARLCVSEQQYMNYITEQSSQFRYWEPGAIYVYSGTDFQKIISDYPKSVYVDDSAYELLLRSRHIDWEGDYRSMLPRIDQCKEFLESYPNGNLIDKVIDLCVRDYNDIINNSRELSDSLKTEYKKELKKFKQQWGRDGR